MDTHGRRGSLRRRAGAESRGVAARTDYTASKTATHRRRSAASQKRELDSHLADIAAVAVDVPEIAAQLGKLNAERRAIEAVLAAADSAHVAIDRKALAENARARLGRTLELLKGPADIDKLRLELKRWVEEIRLDADGKVWIKWQSKTIFELLDMPVTLLSGESGTPFAAKESQLAAVTSWQPLVPNKAPSLQATAQTIGFRGFSGASVA